MEYDQYKLLIELLHNLWKPDHPHRPITFPSMQESPCQAILSLFVAIAPLKQFILFLVPA